MLNPDRSTPCSIAEIVLLLSCVSISCFINPSDSVSAERLASIAYTYFSKISCGVTDYFLGFFIASLEFNFLSNAVSVSKHLLFSLQSLVLCCLLSLYLCFYWFMLLTLLFFHYFSVVPGGSGEYHFIQFQPECFPLWIPNLYTRYLFTVCSTPVCFCMTWPCDMLAIPMTLLGIIRLPYG